MNLGLVTSSFPAHQNDFAGIFVAEHAQALSQLGHEVHVICSGDPDNRYLPPGIASVERILGDMFAASLGAPEWLESDISSVNKLLGASRFCAKQWRTVRKRIASWDAAIAHWLVPCAALVRMADRNIPLLAVAHSGDVQLLERMRAISMWNRLCLTPRTKLSFVSTHLRETFVRHLPSPERSRVLAQSQVCPMGVWLPHNRPSQKPANTVPTILFVGRIVPIKGVTHLIAAARLMPDCHFVIAGDGPDRAALQAIAPCNLEWLGAVSPDRRDELLRLADCLVVTSQTLSNGRQEGMPRILLEAIATRTPVVATRQDYSQDIPPGLVMWCEPTATAIADALQRKLAETAADRADSWIQRIAWPHLVHRLVPDFAGKH